MPFTYLNPHADDFIAKPVSFQLAGRRALTKYRYLFDAPLAEGKTLDILIDGTLSSLISQEKFMLLPAVVRKQILRFELSHWLKLNQLEGKVRIHWSPKTIADRSRLYLFSYKNCVGAFAARQSMIEAFDQKIINLSHFMIRTAEKAVNIRKLSKVFLATEAEISGSPYFSHHFSNIYPIIALPFEVPERFQAKKPFAEREDKACATGSFHMLRQEACPSYYKDFQEFHGLDSYHPIRKAIYDRKEELGADITCRISPYREKRHGLSSLYTKYLDAAQKSYFSFDIVEFYNSHNYAVIGEEIYGLPAIGAFEAMACGCVLIGQKGSFYTSLGLEPNIHFVEHNGTLEDILKVIARLRAHPKEAEAIARQGTAFITSYCRGGQLWHRLHTQLEALKNKKTFRLLSEPAAV